MYFEAILSRYRSSRPAAVSTALAPGRSFFQATAQRTHASRVFDITTGGVPGLNGEVARILQKGSASTDDLLTENLSLFN